MKFQGAQAARLAPLTPRVMTVSDALPIMPLPEKTWLKS